MSDILNTIDNLPDISFIDGLTLEDLQSVEAREGLVD